MKRNVLRNLVMVAKGVKNLLGHCGVKVIYHLYLGENKGRMATIVYLSYGPITFHVTFLITSLSFLFFFFPLFLPFVTLFFFSFFLILFILLLFLVDKGVSRWFPFWGLG